MRIDVGHRLASHYPKVAGLIFLLFGLATIIHPEILTYYSIGLETPEARIAIRAMIGGGEIGIAIILIMGGRIDLSTKQRCWIAAAIFLTVGLSRLCAIGVEEWETVTYQPLREAIVEIVLGFLGVWATQHIQKP